MTPPQDPRPPYQRVADALRTSIRKGDLPPGARIPPLRELMDRYDVSNATAQHAVKLLKAEGLVESKTGSGTRVRHRPAMVGVSSSYLAPAGDGKWPLWRDVAAEQGLKGTERLGRVRTVAAPKDVAAALGLDAKAEVVLRSRVMLLDDEPVQTVASYFPASLADGTPLALPTKISGGAPAVLAHMGHRPAEFMETVTAAMPSPEEASALKLADGVPVLRIFRTVFDADGLAVEVCVMTMNADRHRLEYRLPLHA